MLYTEDRKQIWKHLNGSLEPGFFDTTPDEIKNLQGTTNRTQSVTKSTDCSATWSKKKTHRRRRDHWLAQIVTYATWTLVFSS